MSKAQIPVKIVGRGKVGPCASLFLTNHDIKSILVERHASTSIHPRLRGCNVSTIELYRELGLDEAIRKTGFGPQNRKVVGEQNPLFVNLVGNITPFAGTRGLQDLVDPVLLATARERDRDVRFYTEYVFFEQENEGVIVTVRDRSSVTETKVHADYMTAADGANSLIWREICVGSTGPASQRHFLTTIFEMDLAGYFRGREYSFLRIENPPIQKGEKAEDYAKARDEEIIRVALGLPGVDIKVKSISSWGPSMPPWTGYGVTSAVPNGKAGNALLETYDAERLPVDRLQAEESGALSYEHGLLQYKACEFFKATILRLPRASGLWYSYDFAAVRISSLDLFGKNFMMVAGTRGRAWLKSASETASIFDIDITVYTAVSEGELVCLAGSWESAS
ncbi:FAD-binding monooxygenase-like protein [Calycina marina]|uniref:FAD-binding monooxygenase-like protein n=1 Tax=Calycina marina TaxID=1763456 RepID=A0A9P7Z5Y0_9HELO|nr:FAD-binding monooxygenase-like protein [Calycina marina]